MSQADRGRIATALIFILLGSYLFVVQFFPALQILTLDRDSWPLLIVGFGVIFFLVGVVSWTPGLVVPAAVFGGLGGLMLWQNTTNNWGSWAYAWALIPGFVGVGVFLASLMQGRFREAITAGAWLVLISLILFFIFGSFLGGPNLFGLYWPVLLIALGAIILVQAVWRRTA